MNQYMKNKKVKICGITTRPETAKVMFNNMRYSSENGYDCTIICQPYEPFINGDIEWARYIPLNMNRGNVSPLEVYKATKQLHKILKKEKFDIIIYASSNAGLYASIAGKTANVPIRIYCQWGIPYVDLSGAKRKFYKLIEYLTCKFSTYILPDSHKNLEFAISDNLYPREKGFVLGKGSAQGVNLSRFNINKKVLWRNEIRKIYGIPNDVKVLCFVGRIVPQKGVNELLNAFISLNKNDLYLLVVGPPDEINHLDQITLQKAKSLPNIIFTGSVDDPERYHASADFFILPSYREGFPNTILEAGALGIPSIVTNINGMADLVEDKVNGFLCDVKSVKSLQDSIENALSLSYCDYLEMSENIYQEVRKNYDSNYIKQEYLDTINRLRKTISD